MSVRLPPLNNLRAFEIAARYLSFTQAASELHITPSAVSHQIKLLEDEIGVKLFRRDNNRLLLTEAGTYLMEECSHIFQRLEAATQKVREHGVGRKLQIVLRPYFAQKWLIPHIGGFWEKYPDIEISLRHSAETPDFLDTSVDLAIVWGDGNFTGLESQLVATGDLTPVCSPRLVSSVPADRTSAVLEQSTLLDEDTSENWDQWLKLAGYEGLIPRKRLSIDDTNVRLHAAINGQGVMLTCLSLLGQELRDGVLVAPFKCAMPHYSYYVVYRSGTDDKDQSLNVFVQWLMANTASLRAASNVPRSPCEDAGGSNPSVDRKFDAN
jgi:DNA-binding transcriptional LysR family regulator